MRIALFTETYVPYINGVVTHVKSLKNGLKKLGHEVLIVCANPKVRKHVLDDGVLYCPSVSFKKFCNYGIAVPISPVRFKYVKKFKPDIIHIHTEFSVGYFGALVAKLLRVPLIYTLHTMYDDYLYYVVPGRLNEFAKKTSHAYGKLLAEEATCLTGPSRKVEEYFRNCGVNKSVHVISNPVELDVFNYKNVSAFEILNFRKKFDVKKNELLVCFCGRLGREKSVDVLLKFWSKTVKQDESYKLLIIGDGPCRQELEVYSATLGLTDRVFFAGKVQHANLPVYYSSCDMYVTASLSDTNSISMLEAMACGLPVFHLYDEMNIDQVIDGVNGFFYGNEVEMKQLFDKFKNMTNLQKKELRENSRKSVLKHGETFLAKDLLEVYSEASKINSASKEKFSLKSKFKIRRD